jgi:hypothetical protein
LNCFGSLRRASKLEGDFFDIGRKMLGTSSILEEKGGLAWLWVLARGRKCCFWAYKT